MSTLFAALSSDVDTLESIYKGQGCRRSGGYTYVEFRMGLENFSRFLERYDAKATMFMVGKDFTLPANHGSIRQLVSDGHEIANHTQNHTQGFRLLTTEEKESQLHQMDELAQEIAGCKPVGFRSPGWNLGNDAMPILQKLGYLYDSSVFPTSLMPLMKLMHWRSQHQRDPVDRSTMGHFRYLFSSPLPYVCPPDTFAHRGQGGLVEIPVTVTPILRLPFFATFLLASGWKTFARSLQRLVKRKRPIQFQFHLSDFVDYTCGELAEQTPLPGQGQYVPAALTMPLQQKMDLWTRVLDALAEHYQFRTLAAWAQEVRAQGAGES